MFNNFCILFPTSESFSRTFSDVQIPTKPKLPVLTKVPILPANVRPRKMKKNLHFMRGPEEVHNALLHEQYGIVVSARRIPICYIFNDFHHFHNVKIYSHYQEFLAFSLVF